MSDIGINQVLSQMRAMQAMARNEGPSALAFKLQIKVLSVIKEVLDDKKTR